jgi:BlaI family penicillinase repressor
MARPKSEHPTELELQILKVLWDRSPRAVREVREALAAAGRELAHTSVITTLNIMVRKKYLRRHREGKAYWYEPRIGRAEASHGMLSDMVNRVFNGSAEALVLNLFDSVDFDAEELKGLRRLIDRKTKEQKP